MDAGGEQLALIDVAVGILQVDLSAPNGFDLGAEQLDARLEGFQDEIVMARLYFFSDRLDYFSEVYSVPPSPVSQLCEVSDVDL